MKVPKSLRKGKRFLSEMDEDEFNDQKEDIGFSKPDLHEANFSDEQPDTKRAFMGKEPEPAEEELKEQQEVEGRPGSFVNDIGLDDDFGGDNENDDEELKDEPSEVIKQSTKGLPPLVLTSSLLSKSKERDKKRKLRKAERQKLNEVGLPSFEDFKNRGKSNQINPNVQDELREKRD